MDNSQKFIDLLNKFRESDNFDKKAYQNIVEQKIDLQDYDKNGLLKPQKIVQSLTDVREIIRDIEKEKKKDRSQSEMRLVVQSDTEVDHDLGARLL